MSDFDQTPGSVPPPPPPFLPQAPFGAPVAHPHVAYTVPGYPPVAAAAGQKPPRPAVPVGSAMLVLGGVMLVAGSFLTWFTIFGEEYTGFSEGDSGTKDGPVFVFFGVLALGFGVAQLAARKVLAVGIVAIVFAALALLSALVDLGDVSDAVKLADSIGVDASTGPGLWVILVGSLVALAGGIATVAKRRR